MHGSPSAIENATRLLELSAIRGDSSETIIVSLENVNRQRRKMVAGARNQHYLQLWRPAA